MECKSERVGAAATAAKCESFDIVVKHHEDTFTILLPTILSTVGSPKQQSTHISDYTKSRRSTMHVTAKT